MISQLPSSTGSVHGPHGDTWWHLIGDLGSAREKGLVPLVVLHGGPGIPHDYLQPLASLADEGRPVVFYDQIGCGRSPARPGTDVGTWSADTFVEELSALVLELGIADGFHLLGQSWGGMLAADFAVRGHAGLRSLVLADSPASMALWQQGVDQLRAALPDEVQHVLSRHETAGTTDSEEYKAAGEVFERRHFCRLDPYPQPLMDSLAHLEADPTVYHTMVGPSEFHTVGTLKDWTVVDRLSSIHVPTLVVNGAHDEATDLCVRPFADLIPNARWITFEDSSHVPHLEEPERFHDLVDEFLVTCDHTPERTTPSKTHS